MKVEKEEKEEEKEERLRSLSYEAKMSLPKNLQLGGINHCDEMEKIFKIEYLDE